MPLTEKRTSYSFGFIIIILLFVFTFSCNEAEKKSHINAVEIQKFLKQRPSALQLDSVYLEVIANSPDTVQVDLLLNIFKNSVYKKPLRVDILDTALNISKFLNYNRGMAMSYDRIGLNNRYDLQYQESVEFHIVALQYWELTSDTLGRIKCLNSLGVSLRRLNNEREAMNYYLYALKLSKTINSKKSIAVALNGIGNVFVNIKQYEKALPYFKEALKIEIERGNKKGINYDLSNIGEVFMFQQQFDSALHYYYRALEIARQINYKDNEAINYNCIGLLFQKKGNIQKSNEYFIMAIPQLEKFNGKRYLSNTLINLGYNYSLLGSNEKALVNINKGIKIAKEINSPENIILGYQILSKYYEKRSLYDNALLNFKKTIALRDSVNNEETKRNIAALESIYEKELKDNEIRNYQIQVALQKNQSIMQLTIIVFLLILFSVLFIFYRLKRKNNILIIDQMRNDIQEYVQRIEKYENGNNHEKRTVNENVEQFGLSERETEVLLLISQGLKNNEIAESLFVSLSTIKTHTRNIFLKLDVRNRIEATRKARSL
jgi:DNA-binding CsgD family transcriptional regulator/tetratricopeptide (TPR) repeat protein